MAVIRRLKNSACKEPKLSIAYGCIRAMVFNSSRIGTHCQQAVGLGWWLEGGGWWQRLHRYSVPLLGHDPPTQIHSDSCQQKALIQVEVQHQDRGSLLQHKGTNVPFPGGKLWNTPSQDASQAMEGGISIGLGCYYHYYVCELIIWLLKYWRSSCDWSCSFLKRQHTQTHLSQSPLICQVLLQSYH